MMNGSGNVSKKIKICIGANDLLLAGVQRLVIDQLRLLDRELFEIHLVVLMRFASRETFEDRIPRDVSVHQLSFSGFYDIRQWWKLLHILRGIRPDLVKTATFFSNTVFLLLKPLFGYVVIAAEHNTVSAKPFWQQAVDRILLPHACTIVGDSVMTVEFVSKIERIPRERFTVIYNGVDLDAVASAQQKYGSQRREMRNEYGILPGTHLIFTAGRLVRQKNHRLMIEAFSLIHARQPNTQLMIAGEGALRPELESLIKELNLEKSVILLGEKKDVFRFYAMADSFLLTSRHEGFCIAAMEGLAFGLPLISTRVAGVSEYLEDEGNGFFVEDNPEDIAQKMLKILAMDADMRERFSEEGRRTAEKYSTKRYGEVYNELFLRCAKIITQ